MTPSAIGLGHQEREVARPVRFTTRARRSRVFVLKIAVTPPAC